MSGPPVRRVALAALWTLLLAPSPEVCCGCALGLDVLETRPTGSKYRPPWRNCAFVSASTVDQTQFSRKCTPSLFSSTTSDENDGADHPLNAIGSIFQEELDDESVGKNFQQAGLAWADKDWGGVTDSLGQAAVALSDYAEKTPAAASTDTPPLLWQRIAQELQDISTIEGCSSVGPPASIPNWVAIQEELRSSIGDNELEWANSVNEEIDRLLDSI
jgi:hypothetical protein